MMKFTGRFSETRQPARRSGPREHCRKGHPMTEGDPNVRVRGDGKRVCRACESDRRAEVYAQRKRIEAGVPGPPFELENPYYDLEVYEHTSTDVLSKFYGWQKDVLDKAKQNPKGSWNRPSGVIKASFMIETLEREMPILYQYILEKMEKS